MANITVYPFGTDGTLPGAIGLINDLRTGGVDNALTAEQGKVIGEIIGEVQIIQSEFTGMTHFKDGYQLKANSEQVGKALNNVTTYAAANYQNIKVPIAGYSRIKMRQFSTSYEFGSLIVDANDIVLKGIINDTGTYYDMYIDIPAGAEYLVLSFPTTSTYDKTVTLYKANGIIPRLEVLESQDEETTEETVTGKSPELTSGRLNSTGANVGGNYLTTETIFGDFYIHVADGWKLYEAHIYNRAGRMVSYRYYNPNTPTPVNRWNASFALQEYGNGNTVPEFGLRLVFCKTDTGAIAAGENPVDNFVLFADTRLRRWVPDDLPNYDVAQRRIDYIQHLRWTPLAKVSDSTAAATNDYYFAAGQLAVGVSYSDVAETMTYVPNFVSIRTFMTAVKNRRSLLYTEDLENNVSKYGKSYKSGVRKCYYGAVCSSFTAWVMGLPMVYLSGAYGNNTVPGLTSVANPNANNVRPLDLIWCDGHISIITDIYKDEFGKVAFVVWGEMSSPYPHRTIYTPAQFEARLLRNGGYTVHRWDGWANLPEPDASEYSQYLLGATRREPKTNGDIMCFAGDYAAFAEGEIIYLNARRNSIYTGVELYKDDTLLQTIDITGLSADTIVTPNTEDWVAVNLTSLGLTAGKYKARLTDGENTTDYTHFEVIDVTFSAVKSGNDIVVTIGSTTGTPTGVEKVKDNGFANSYHIVTAEEVAAGSITLSWTYNATYKYLMIFVKGDYGTVNKIINFPTS